jgi:hypothetical protein
VSQVVTELVIDADAATADSLSTGAGRRVLAQQFGLKPFTGQ